VPRYVIDAATLLHLLATGAQVAPEHQLVAPHLLRSQALSLLYEAVRRGELTREEAQERHERLTAMKTRLLGDRVSRAVAWRIAEERDCDTTYDAEYLAVTRLQADAFVTVDARMAKLAAGVVALATVTDLASPPTSS
jgi:predicted nucleic acid-binding protein